MQLANFYRTPNGNIKVDAEVQNNVIISIKLTGDFYIKPVNALPLLEKHLTGVELKRELVSNTLNIFYLFGMESLNATNEDIVNAILGLRDKKASGKI